MPLIENSEQLVGYQVKIIHKEAFRVVGYTRTFPSNGSVPQFWDEVIADGRLDKLVKASPTPPCIFGVGSWDDECQPKGSRYTLGIEETEQFDLARIANEPDFYVKQIGESDWMCFEFDFNHYMSRFWKDNPYKMMGPLGYEFHGSEDYSLGLHFEIYPPDFNAADNPRIEFWISVIKSQPK